MKRTLVVSGGLAALALAAAVPTVAQAATRPVNTRLPRISGAAVEGSVLRASHGSWTQHPSSFTYRWQRCPVSGRCTTVAHRTSRRYTLTSADVGHRIRVVVTASNGLRSRPARSRRTGIVTRPLHPPVPAPYTCPTSPASSAIPVTAYQLNSAHSGFTDDSFPSTGEWCWSADLWHAEAGAAVEGPVDFSVQAALMGRSGGPLLVPAGGTVMAFR